MTKTLRALKSCGLTRVHVVGGAAANSALRASLVSASQELGFSLRLPPLAYCGDNAAMIAAAACARVEAGIPPSVDLYANRPLDHEALALPVSVEPRAR